MFYKLYHYSKVFFNRHVVSFFEAIVMEEAVFFIIFTNSISILTPKLKKITTYYIAFVKLSNLWCCDCTSRHFCVCFKSKTLRILLVSNSFPEKREIRSKKYFTDLWTTNTIQLFVAIKGTSSGLFFIWTSRSEGEFSRCHLINIATFLFSHH